MRGAGDSRVLSDHPSLSHASRWGHTDSLSWDFIPLTNSAELCSKIFTPNVQNSDRFDPINCIPRTGASNCGSQTDFFFPDSFWLDCLAFIVLTVPTSSFLNAFCLLRGLIKKPATEAVLRGSAKKNLFFLINITGEPSQWRCSWGRQKALIAPGHCWPGGGVERRGLTQAICLLCASSDVRVTECYLLLRSCSDFQGEQKLQTP